MKKITVLGAGMVGRAIAIDLAKKYKVLSIDHDPKNLQKLSGHPNIKTKVSDLSNKDNIRQGIMDCELAVNAVPGFMGFETTKEVIKAGVNIVDISFFPENCFDLDELARYKSVIAVVDCGVAPGMGNVILGYHNSKMQVESYECYVGGLPFSRTLPFQYKAPFSPIDVMEEYIRPARYIKNGKEIVLPALTESEFMEFAEIGTLQAFNTDGLRSLLFTMEIPDMIEKTLRYPGHIDQIKFLKDTGLLSEDEVNINGNMIKPLDLTAKLLIDQWKLGEKEPEFTVMKIIIKGREDGVKVKWTYDLFDRFDEETGISSMARTTGYSATSAVELVLNGDYDHIGISPPEFIGAEDGCLDKMLAYQKERGIVYHIRKSDL